MFEFIEKIRQKPEGLKKKVAFLASFFIAGLIFVIWLSVIYPNIMNNKKVDSLTEKRKEDPISSLANIISSGVYSVSNELGSLKDLISNVGTKEDYFSASSSKQTSKQTLKVE